MSGAGPSPRGPIDDRGEPAREPIDETDTLVAQASRELSRVRRAFFVVLGLLSLGVGAIGVVVPGLPTTVFVLAAVYFFARGNPRLECWVREHRVFGAYLRLGQRGMPRRARVTAIILMWTAITLSVIALGGGGPVLPIVIVVLGVAGTAYLTFGLRGGGAGD